MPFASGERATIHLALSLGAPKGAARVHEHTALPIALFAHYLQRIADGAEIALSVLSSCGGDDASACGETIVWQELPLAIDDATTVAQAATQVQSALAGARATCAPPGEAPAGVALLHPGASRALPPDSPPLVLTYEEASDAWALAFARQRVSESAARRMAGHLQTLVNAAVAATDEPLGALEFLTAGERELLIERWNDTASPYDRDDTVHGMIAAAATRAPSAVAVIGRDERLSFAELLEAADRWAVVLRAHGVGPDVLVGIRMHRTPAMVIAILAVLQAGGAYVPIDPSWPRQRALFVARDAELSLLLTSHALANDLPRDELGSMTQLMMDDAPPATHTTDTPAAVAGAEDLAYVIYTSGSTGTPKGVLVEHRGVVNYLTWCISAYELGDGHGAPAHSSLAFDLTVTSLLAPLAAGRTVTLVHDDDDLDGLGDALREQPGFSLVKLTPAHLDVLRAQLSPEKAARATRRFVVGGEALHARTLEYWRQNAPDTVIVNEYGPTETVVGCCVHEIRAGDLLPDPVPIGRPIANTRLHVLDGARRLLPVGVPGELYIGGDGVARGYLRRPELTEARFVRDPFTNDPSARLYRTGDRVRRLEDGTLEFLGRFDDQVKVQGYRIELGEVEHALRAHPEVHDAAVAVREIAPGDARLVAWVVPSTGAERSGSHRSGERLARWLGERLPAYMVPARWMWLGALPLTRNGKVDRRSLPTPAPEAPARAGGDSGAAAESALEERLLGIWGKVLGTAIGVEDDFFASGGSSMLAARMIGTVREQLGERITFSMLLASPTIRQLARHLEQERAPRESPIVKLNEGRPGVPPLFYFHGALGFYMLDVARQLHPEQPFYIVHPVESNGPATIEEMAALRLRQLRAIQPAGPYHLAGTCNGGSLAYAVACRLHDEGETVGLLALVNAHVRTAGLRPLRRGVHMAARAARLSAERELELWLRVRDRATWIVPQLPYTGPGAKLAERLRFGVALPLHALRVMGRRLRRLSASAAAEATAPQGADEDPEAADSVDARQRYHLHDVALRSWFPRRYHGTLTLIFWEQSFALRDGDGIHGRDRSRGWARHCADVRIRYLPGSGNDLDSRDKRALAHELTSLLREEHARHGVGLHDDEPDARPRGAPENAA